MKRLFGRLLILLSDAYRQCLVVSLAIIGPRPAYWLAAKMAGMLYAMHQPLRQISETHVRAALGDRLDESAVRELARRAFVHRTWDFVDLLLVRYRIYQRNYAALGGRIDDEYLNLIHKAQADGRCVLLVTCYYGPFDLLPVFLGYNGVRALVVYKRHANPRFDAFRKSVRSKSGCELVPIEEAMDRITRTMESGGVAALVADHMDDDRGVPISFLGAPTTAMRSVGLLAWRYDAAVVVAGIRRMDNCFRYRLTVADMFDPSAWTDKADPIVTITERYVRALERIVLDDPSQYLWGYCRWGRPAANGATPTSSTDQRSGSLDYGRDSDSDHSVSAK